MTDQLSLLDLIRARTSVRVFDGAPVPEADILALAEAARWSASWGNQQPWRLVVVRTEERRAALASSYSRGNGWAALAPVVFVMVGDRQAGKSRGDEPFYLFDCGLAAQSLILEAARRRLAAHPFAGWDDAVVSRAIAAPSNVRPVVLIAVGRENSAADQDSNERPARPHTRLPLHELAFAEQWQQPLAPAEAAD